MSTLSGYKLVICRPLEAYAPIRRILITIDGNDNFRDIARKIRKFSI